MTAPPHSTGGPLRDDHGRRGRRRATLAWIALALGLAGALSWLSRPDWSDPEAVLTRFLEARYATDVETVYDHLSAADRTTASRERFALLYGVDDSVWVAPILERATFAIEQLDVDGAEATAHVRVREPDMRIAMSRLFSAAMATAAEGGSPGALDASLASKARRLRVPMVEAERRFALVHDAEEGWRIDLRLGVRPEVERLVREAEAHAEARRLERARALYREALALDDTRLDLLERIEDVEFRMLPPAEQDRRQREAVDAALAEMRAQRARRRGLGQ